MTTAPIDDLGFEERVELKDFEGCYKNCSDPADGSAMACLSHILWTESFDDDDRPEAVLVRKTRDNRLSVAAIVNGIVFKESIFEEGKHFHFIGGRIELVREYIASGATEPGNVFIGVGTGKTVIGIDPEGHGRIKQSAAFAGTGFLIIPIAGSATDVSKVERSAGLCDEADKAGQ